MPNIPAIQSALREFGIDAWLLGDFRGSNILARRVLGLAFDICRTAEARTLRPVQFGVARP